MRRNDLYKFSFWIRIINASLILKLRKSFAFHIINTQETLAKTKKKYFCIILNFNEQRIHSVCRLMLLKDIPSHLSIYF